MKKLAFIVFLVSFYSIAQTDGLSYQAVIIDPDIQEVPGVDISGNVLNKQDVTVRFTIINEAGNAQYRETQGTRTDAFGMIHLIIGRGEVDFGNFHTIVWDGTAKQLKVEVNLGNGFKFQEEKELLYVPYAFHRDLIATKELQVAGNVTFDGNIEVDGKTNLNDDLAVNNQTETKLSGLLSVDGQTILNDSLTVANQSPTGLRGTLSVAKETLLKDSLVVRRRTRLKAALDVEENTNLNNGLNVENASPTVLTGSLKVDGETNILSDVNVNNGSNVDVSGDMLVQGATTLEQDLTVNGITNLNNTVQVNNQAPTAMTGTLTTEGPTRIENTLIVLGKSNLDGNLNVNGQNPTQLSGTLTVGLETNFNNSLTVHNAAPTDLSGDLTVGGDATFNSDVTINGVTNLNNDLFVNNGSPTNLSGTLTVNEAVNLNSTLNVDGATTLEDGLSVLNGANTMLSGTNTVDGAALLQNTLTVANGSASSLNGTLTVDGITNINDNLNVTGSSSTNLSGTLYADSGATLGDDLTVANGSATALSGELETYGTNNTFNSTFRVNNGAATTLTGSLDVSGGSTFGNTLNVTNAAPTNFSGLLTVAGATQINNTATISGITLIQNDLTVTQAANMPNIFTTKLTISDDQVGAVSTFENTNTGTSGADSGDGILIKLGRTHGAYNGAPGSNNPSDYLQVNNPYLSLYQSQLTAVGNLLSGTSPSGTSIDVNDIIALIPANMAAGQFGSIGNSIIGEINNRLGLPVNTPELAVPRTTIFPEVTIYSGSGQICSGQYCFNPCTFFNCTICIPPIEFCVPELPRIYIPAIVVPRTTLVPAINNIVPAFPQAIPEIGPGDAVLSIPNVSFGLVSNSMSKENVFMSFQDQGDRQTGAVVAQSTLDFLGNTILDPVYAINVVAGFVGADLVDGLVTGGVEMSNLIDTFNKIGVSYESGHGDYAEWLPRENLSEYITAGDIVAIRGGKISKDLNNFEQLLVVSHKPIVLGNNPDEKDKYKGNPVAFLGQVPVKVIGPVQQGDFIIADTQIAGYGRAISEENMQPTDYQMMVGRSWETNANEGPKLVKIVMGLYTNGWIKDVNAIETQQQELDKTIESLELKLQRISKKLNTTKERDYASINKK